jgi:S-adenosylmethionine hydrolase
VGTARRALALRTPGGVFLGPDNGILSAALPDVTRSRADEAAAPVPLPEEVLGVALSNPRYHRQPVSDTFHGRDIFAPAAAHLSLGVPLSDLGEVVSEVFALPPFRARRQPDGGLSGRVVHIDAFGNLITDVRREDVASQRVTVEIGGRRIEGLQRTYAEKPGVTALAGSSGFLEIALAGGSAAAELAADIGEPVVVRGG